MDEKKLLAPEAKPTPTPHEKAGLQVPTWLGRTIAHKDHVHELEHAAALNEFRDKMPRPEAEEKAHGDYVQRQHTEAAAHHLSGMKAAHASGDMEAARKHGVMYELHSKALGHKAVGPAHPDVLAHMEKKPGGVYKFKAHRGDLFAIDKKPEEEKVDKSEALRAVYEALEPLTKKESDLNKWAKAELKARKSKPVPCRCDAYSHPHRTGGGKCPAGK
jgi:hypothetical protein